MTSLAQLDKLIDEGHHEYCIASGLLHSSKHITKDGDTYFVLHYIDDTEEQLTATELLQENIGKAINNGTFYCEL